jgi:arylsulfatase A-like enzyme
MRRNGASWAMAALVIWCASAGLLAEGTSQGDSPPQVAQAPGSPGSQPPAKDSSSAPPQPPAGNPDKPAAKNLFDALQEAIEGIKELPEGEKQELRQTLGEAARAWRDSKDQMREAIRRVNRQIRVKNCDAPNIVLIEIDDLGYADLGCYGQTKIKTPNIDRLAAEGLRCTNYYAGTGLGTPSRCALHTGFHSGHCRLRGNNPPLPLLPHDLTLAEVLWQAGYTTGYVGTWALGDVGTTGVPNRQGYDSTFGYLSRPLARDHFPDFLWRNEEKVILEGNREDAKAQFSHDLFTQEAVAFLDRVYSQPFFLNVGDTLPHNLVGQIDDLSPYENEDWPLPQKRYAAMITRIDESVGRIVQRLKDLGVYNHTIIILTADNGPHNDEGVDPAFFQSTGPYRGIKGSLYEGGIRVPMIIRGPGPTAARVSDHVWAAWDLMPTIAEWAGAWSKPRGIDGYSQAATPGGGVPSGHEYLYWELHDGGFVQAIRQGKWKALRRGLNGPLELYDLSQDPGEKTDVAAQNPQVVQKLDRLLGTARTASPHWPVP